MDRHPHLDTCTARFPDGDRLSHELCSHNQSWRYLPVWPMYALFQERTISAKPCPQRMIRSLCAFYHKSLFFFISGTTYTTTQLGRFTKYRNNNVNSKSGDHLLQVMGCAMYTGDHRWPGVLLLGGESVVRIFLGRFSATHARKLGLNAVSIRRVPCLRKFFRIRWGSIFTGQRASRNIRFLSSLTWSG